MTLAFLALSFGGTASAQQGDPNLDAIEAGADWQLTQQTAAGAYPWSVGGPLNDEVHGAIARGMLLSNEVVPDPAYLDSAVATGDYLVQSYPRQFSDGDPDIHPLDVLFLHELSRITGDPVYANFIRANLWGKLRLGIYGENDDQDVVAWADTIPVLDDYDFYVAMEPLFRALPAIAAYYVGEPEMSNALMLSAIENFEDLDALSDTRGDLPGIAAAVLASVHTGFNLDPTVGRFADFDTTQEFVEYMVGFQRPTGDWPAHTGNPPGFVGDVSTTSWVVIALKVWSTAQYQPEIDNALGFIRSLQQPNGQILTNPGWSPNTVTGIQVHAEALLALGTDDGEMLNIVTQPLNQAPFANDDSASTAEETAVNIDVLSNDSDIDGALDPASVQISVPAANGATSVDPTTGVVTYTPNAGFSGVDSFAYTVADDLGASSYDAQVSITVSGRTVVLTPIADAYISASQVGTNFGSANDLQYRRQAGNHRLSYIKFDVDAQGGTIEGATVRLRLTSPSGGSATFYSASNNYAGSAAPWTETGLTWLNADRTTGDALATLSGLNAPGWFEVDVSGFVSAGGQFSFAIFNASISLGAFSSREGAFPPELVLQITDPLPPDVTAPVVTITSPTSAATFTTESSTINLGGTASDDTAVDSVSWVNNRGGAGTAFGTGNWSVSSITLQPGDNQITVTANDAAGNSSNDVITVTYNAPDVTPPTVTITSPTSAATFATEAPTISLGGTASDDTAVDSVTWSNDRGGSGTASGTDTWSVGSVNLQLGVNQITVTATDAAGNSSTDVLTVTYSEPDVTAPTVSITSPTSAATFTTESLTISLGGTASDDTAVDSVAWVNDRGGSGTASGTDNWSVGSVALQPGANQITVTATDAAGNSSADVLTVTYNEPDVTPPTVTITSPTTAATFTTESSTISLGGTASDDTAVDSVSWANNRGGSGTASGTDNWSVGSITLQPGVNQITVTASDAAGNSSNDVITVTYDTPDVTAPSVTITSPTSAATFTTESATISLGGTASDDTAVDSVTWVNDRGGSGTAAGTDNWSVGSVALQLGANQITVTAMDAAGNSSTDVLAITYNEPDVTAPTVSITSPTSAATFTTESSTVNIGGTASDDTGVTSVTWVNDRGGSGTASGTDNWSVASITLQPGVNQITVTASDAAGNSSNDVITVTYNAPDVTPPTVTITSPTSSATLTTEATTTNLGGTASDDTGVTSVTWANDRGGSGTASGTDNWSVGSVALQLGANQITVTATDAAGNSSTDVLTVTREAPNQPPTATITAPANGATFSIGQTLVYAGTATDAEDGTLPASAYTWQAARVGGPFFPLAQGVTSGSSSILQVPGTFIIRLTVQDSEGLTDIDDVTITVQ